MRQRRGQRRRRPDAGLFVSASGEGRVTQLAAIFMFTSLELISDPTLRREAERKGKFPPEAVLCAREGVINAPLRCDRSRSGRSFSHRYTL